MIEEKLQAHMALGINILDQHVIVIAISKHKLPDQELRARLKEADYNSDDYNTKTFTLDDDMVYVEDLKKWLGGNGVLKSHIIPVIRKLGNEMIEAMGELDDT